MISGLSKASLSPKTIYFYLSRPQDTYKTNQEETWGILNNMIFINLKK